jgi:hypothetical protein
MQNRKLKKFLPLFQGFFPTVSATRRLNKSGINCLSKSGQVFLIAKSASPEHFKQLCGMAKLGWPMVRERIKTMCRQILDATREPQVLPELRDATVREIVTKRAERMLSLMDKIKGVSNCYIQALDTSDGRHRPIHRDRRTSSSRAMCRG